ncbi:MAG: hypothetical protein U0X39_06555 [Bacteroidales bacterium]
MNKQIKAGLFGIGLDTYWAQFPGLLEKLNGYLQGVSDKLTALDCVVVNAGMVDNPSKAVSAAGLFNREEVDIIILNISTYALSHNVLPLLQRTKAPLLVLNLQPMKAIDYTSFNSLGDRGLMTGEWLSFCQSCVTPELASVFNRAGIGYHLITGWLDDNDSWKEISDWLDASRIKKVLSETRVGVLGHYYNGMLDVYSDITMLAAAFGCHFELFEFGLLKQHTINVAVDKIDKEIESFRGWFDVSPDCTLSDLRSSAASSVALRELAAELNIAHWSSLRGFRSMPPRV